MMSEREAFMNLTIDLPAELESELSAAATQAGLSLSEYAVRILSASRTQAAMPSNGADLVSYWEKAGLIGTRPDIADGPAHARALRRQAEKRERT